MSIGVLLLRFQPEISGFNIVLQYNRHTLQGLQLPSLYMEVEFRPIFLLLEGLRYALTWRLEDKIPAIEGRFMFFGMATDAHVVQSVITAYSALSSSATIYSDV